jgi:hypothetical protein
LTSKDPSGNVGGAGVVAVDGGELVAVVEVLGLVAVGELVPAVGVVEVGEVGAGVVDEDALIGAGELVAAVDAVEVDEPVVVEGATRAGAACPAAGIDVTGLVALVLVVPVGGGDELALVVAGVPTEVGVTAGV